MRVLLKDDATGVALEFHPDTYSCFKVSSPIRVMNSCNLSTALDWFDKFKTEANNAPVTPTLNLDHPPKGLQTTTGRAVRVVGKVKTLGYYPYVLAIKNETGDTESVYYARQDGKVEGSLTLTTGPVKKEGWTVIFPANNHPERVAYSSGIYPTRKEAEAYKARNHSALGIGYIAWEE